MSSFPLKGTLQSRNVLAAQVLVAIALQAAAFASIFGYFYGKHTIIHDQFRLFATFRDIMVSLNHYGEIPWWHPNANDGFPYYYLSMLGTVATTPLYVVTALAFWLLGRMGVTISDVMGVYIVYQGFAVPLLMSLGMLAVAREMFRRKAVIFFVQLFCAFSPFVVFCVSDSGGQELCAYGFFFAAALLRHLRAPTRASLWLLYLTVLILAVSLCQLFLYWTAVFVPLFALVVAVFRRDRPRRSFEDWSTGLRKGTIGVLALVAALCALPALLTYRDGADIARQTTDTRVYDLAYLRAGNPLEVLMAGVPVGFTWDRGFHDHESQWQPAGVCHDEDPWAHGVVAYQYAGMAVLPLALIGLIFGRTLWRLRLLALIGVFGGVVLLSSGSALFSGILAVVAPLRSVNHYSDNPYRLGICLLLILAAATGFDTVLRCEAVRRRWWPALFAAVSLASLATYAYFMRACPISGYADFSSMVFCFVVLLALIIAISRARPGGRREAVIGLFLFFSFIDISTVSYQHVRTFLWPLASGVFEARPAPAADAIGLPKGDASNWLAEKLLVLRYVRDAKASDPAVAALPDLGIYDAPARRPLADAAVTTESQSYNHLAVTTSSPRPAVLIWKDAWFRYWHASVDGREVPVSREWGAYKGVEIPQGTATVRFWFFPWRTALALLAAYAMVIGAAVMALRALWTGGKARQGHVELGPE